MKFRKQQQVLRGVTAVRISLGFTQLQFGMYIGVSRTMVSGVERGERHFNTKVLQRIADLEKTVQFNREVSLGLAAAQYEESLELLEGKQKHEKNTKTYFEMELKMMVEVYNETAAALQQVNAMIQSPVDSVNQFGPAALEEARKRLTRRLRSNNLIEQAKIAAKIATADIMFKAYSAAVVQETADATVFAEEVSDPTAAMPAFTPALLSGSQHLLTNTELKTPAPAIANAHSIYSPSTLRPLLPLPGLASQLLALLHCDGSGEKGVERAA